MTPSLKSLMKEEADAQSVPFFDAASIAATGGRQRRRRHAAGAAAAVAAVSLGALTLAPLLDGRAGQRGDGFVAADGGAATHAVRQVNYAIGQVIHNGTDTIDVGRRIVSYVQTTDGFVYATGNGDVWLHDGTGSERIGHSEHQRLRADSDGSLVAWVDRGEDGAREYVLFDTADSTEVARLDGVAGPSPEDGGAEVYAVDEGYAYWRGADGLVRYEIGSGETEVLASPLPVTDPANKPEQPTEIVDASGGVIAYRAEGERGSKMMVGRSLDESARQLPMGWNGVLSPGGRYIGVEDEDRLAVYDTVTGAEVTPTLDRYPFKVAYGWVDEDTAMVFAIKRLGDGFPSDFLACDVPQGTCEVVAEEDAVEDGSFVLPVGDPMDT